MHIRSMVVGFLGILLLATFARAETIDLAPVADSYVRASTYANSNFGTEANLIVKNAGDTDQYTRKTYMKFDLSTIPATASGAKLKLTLNSITPTSTTLKVYSVTNDAWTETGITWNNRPSGVAVLTQQAISTVGVTYEFDISAFIASEQAGDRVATIAIIDGAVTGVYTSFNSRENAFSRPALTVTYTPDTTPPSVVSAAPADGQELDPYAPSVRITFSELMDRVSVENAFAMSGVSGAFSWAGNALTFSPATPLAPATSFTVTVGTGAKDIAGNALVQPLELRFNTGKSFGTGTGLYAQYFSDRALTVPALTRIEPVNFDWSTNTPEGLPSGDNFSARWTGWVEPRFSGTFTFFTRSDNGVRLWVNGTPLIDNWTAHSVTENSGTIALQAGEKYLIKMDFYESTGSAVAKLLWQSTAQAKEVIPVSQLYPVQPASIGSGIGLLGEYFVGSNFEESKLFRLDAGVDFNWSNAAPNPKLPSDKFSVVWTGQVEARYNETYTFYTYTDDGTRLWVNGQQLVNDWLAHSPTEHSGTITLQAGQRYDLRMEYFESTSGAVASLRWSSFSQPKQVIPATQLYPSIGNVVLEPSKSSPTSPAWVEGGVTRDLHSLSLAVDGTEGTYSAYRLNSSQWFAQSTLGHGGAIGIRLKSDAPTILTVTASSVVGSVTALQSITWVPTELQSRTSEIDQCVIRRGDALLLTAVGEGSVLEIDGDGDGVHDFQGNVGDRTAFEYQRPGIYVAAARIDGVTVGSFQVKVVDADLSRDIAGEVGYARSCDIPVSPPTQAGHVVFVPNETAALESTVVGPFTNEDGQGTRLTIKPLRRGRPVLTARVDLSNGPIIAYREMDEFTLDLPASVSALRDPESGTAKTSVRISPYIPDLEIELTMFAHTATFEGGVKSLRLNTSSFLRFWDSKTKEEVGELGVTLEVPATENKYCFRVRAIQATALKRQVSNLRNVNGSILPLNVTVLPTAPVAHSDAYTTPQDTPLTVLAPGVLQNDTRSGTVALAAILLIEPANGTLQMAADGPFVYVPNAGFSGVDGFTYQASDGLRSNVAAVRITVTPTLPPGEDRYWVAQSEAVWSDAQAWSATSGGPGGAGAPSPNDMAYFDGNSLGSCLIDGPADVRGIRLEAGFPSTIMQNASAPISVGQNGFVQTAGTFNGGSDPIQVRGRFELVDGAFKATRGTLTLSGNFSIGNALFSSNGGTVLFNGLTTINVFNVIDFHNFVIDCPDWSAVTVAPEDSLVINGALSLLNGWCEGGRFLIRGGTTIAQGWDGGDSLLRFIGTSDQTVSGPGTYLGPVAVDKPSDKILSITSETLSLFGGLRLESGTLQVSESGTLHLEGTIVFVNGTFDPSTGTVAINGPGVLAASNEPVFHHLVLDMGDNDVFRIGVATGDPLVVEGRLSLLNGRLFSDAVIDSQGDVVVSPRFDAMDATLQIGGSEAQRLSAEGGAGVLLQNLVVAKPDGVLTLADTLEIHGSILNDGGEIDAGTSTVVMKGATGCVIGEGIAFNHLIINNKMANSYLGGGVRMEDNVTVHGTLTVLSGVLTLPDDGVVHVRGNVDFVPGLWRLAAKRSTVLIDGTTPQRISAEGQVLYNLWVTNTSAAVTLERGLSVERLAAFEPGTKISFGAGETFTFAHIAMTGTETQPIQFRSAVAGQQSLLAVAECPAVCHRVDIRDIRFNGVSPFQAINSTDSGNNSNLRFVAGPMVAIQTPASSRTNPAWVEGVCRTDVSSLTIATNDLTSKAVRLSHTRWFAGADEAGSRPLGIPLNAVQPTAVTVTAANGHEEFAVQQELQWTLSDLQGLNASADHWVVRRGDALLLTATGTGTAMTLDINGDGATEYAGTPGDRFEHIFDQPGLFHIIAKIDGALAGSILLHVLDVNLPESMASEVGFRVPTDIAIFPAELSSRVVFEANDPALLEVVELGWSTTGGIDGKKIGVRPIQRGVPVLTARIVNGTGPVIAYKEVEEFTRELPGQKEIIVSGTSGIGATPVIIRPYVPNLTLQFTMFGQRSTFVGGQTTLTVNTSEINPLTGKLRFEQFWDDYTGETVAFFVPRVEVPAGETIACFRASTLRADTNQPISHHVAVNGRIVRVHEPFESIAGGMHRSVQSSFVAYSGQELPLTTIYVAPQNRSTSVNGLARSAPAAAIRTAGVQKYRLSVSGGTGTGMYAPGDVVTISPVGNQRWQFDHWETVESETDLDIDEIDDEVTNPNARDATFVMAAANTRIKASYEKKYQLRVKNGTGTGVYAPGTQVTIAPQGIVPPKALSYWVLKDRTKKFEMTFVHTTGFKNFAIGGKLAVGTQVNVIGGSGTGYYGAEMIIPIALNPLAQGLIFEKWELFENGVYKLSIYSQNFPYNLPRYRKGTVIELRPVIKEMKFSLTLKNGTVKDGNANNVYAGGARLTINYVPSSPTKGFQKWDGPVDNPDAPTTTFTMPFGNAEIEALEGPDKVSLTVVGGTGSGEYTPGTAVSISAPNVFESKIFVKWDAVLHTSRGPSPFDLPSNNLHDTTIVTQYWPITVTATYRYPTLTVFPSPGVAIPKSVGEQITLPSPTPPAGYIFDGWTSDVVLPNVNLSEDPLVFLIPEQDLTVTANYRNRFRLTLTKGTLQNGSRSGDFNTGDTVWISADDPADGQIFDHWSGAATINSAAAPYTSLLMPVGDTTIEATYTVAPPNMYTLVVSRGQGSGNYVAGDTVSISADAPEALKVFDRWTGANDSDYLNISESSTVFTMPAHHVRATPTYKNKPFLLTVVKGKLDNGQSAGMYPHGTSVSIAADPAPEGYRFLRWTGATVVDDESETTELAMPTADTIVTATYKRVYKLTLISAKLSNGTDIVTFDQGTRVDFEATIPANMFFHKWEGFAVNSVNATPTYLVMPESDVTVRAIFRHPRLTVTNGTGSGEYPAGTVVTVGANCLTSPYRAFVNWTGAAVDNPNESITTFVMPGNDVTVVPHYEVIEDVYSVVTEDNPSPCIKKSNGANEGEVVVDFQQVDLILGSATSGTKTINFNRRIVTVNTPRGRELSGKFKIKLANAADPETVKILNGNLEFKLGTGYAFADDQGSHFGCGRHCWHGSSLSLGFVARRPGTVKLVAEADPDFELEGDGIPTKRALVSINVHGADTLTVSDEDNPQNAVTAPAQTQLYLLTDSNRTPRIRIDSTRTDVNLLGSQYLWKIDGAGASPATGNFGSPGTATLSRFDQTYLVKSGFDANNNGVLDSTETLREITVNIVKMDGGAHSFGCIVGGTLIPLPEGVAPPEKYRSRLNATHLLFPAECQVDDKDNQAFAAIRLGIEPLDPANFLNVVNLVPEEATQKCVRIKPDMYEGPEFVAYINEVNWWHDLFGSPPEDYISPENMYLDLLDHYGITEADAADGKWWETPGYTSVGRQSPIHFKIGGNNVAGMPPVVILVKQPIKISQAMTTVSRFEKYEADIVLDDDYFHHLGDGTRGLKQKNRFDAFDADGNGEKIIVDARFRLMSSSEPDAVVITKDGSAQIYDVPCFQMKETATGPFKWKVRFSPPYETIAPQVWEMTVRAAVWHNAKHDTPDNYDELNLTSKAPISYYHYYGYNDAIDSPAFAATGNQHLEARKFYAQTNPIRGIRFDQTLPKPTLRFKSTAQSNPGPIRMAKAGENSRYFYRQTQAGAEPIFLIGTARPWSVKHPDTNFWGTEFVDLESEIFSPSKTRGCNVVNIWNSSWFTNICHREQKERWPTATFSVPGSEWEAWLYFDQARAMKLDNIFQLARDYDQYIQFSLFDPYDLRNVGQTTNWGNGAYNSAANANGVDLGMGFSTCPTAANVTGFFRATDDNEAGKALKNYLRYYIARWGWSRNLALIQPLTEWDGAGLTNDDTDKVAWTSWIFNKLRDAKFNPYTRPLSISRPWMEKMSLYPNDYDETAVLNGVPGPNGQVSYVNHHGYFQNINNEPDKVGELISYDLVSGHISEWEKTVRRNATSADKPLLCGEFGIKERGLKTDGYDSVFGKKRYPTYVHYALWAGLCTGYAGTPMKWSDGKEFGEMRAREPASDGFTTTKFPYDLWLEYEAISKFVSSAPKPDFNSLRRNEIVTCSATDIKVFCLSKVDAAVGFVYNSALVVNPVTGVLDTCAKTGLVTIPGMAGTFEVAWYNTWTGQMIGTWTSENVKVEGGNLTFPLPSFADCVAAQPNGSVVRDRNDIAFKVRLK